VLLAHPCDHVRVGLVCAEYRTGEGVANRARATMRRQHSFRTHRQHIQVRDKLQNNKNKGWACFCLFVLFRLLRLVFLLLAERSIPVGPSHHRCVAQCVAQHAVSTWGPHSHDQLWCRW